MTGNLTLNDETVGIVSSGNFTHFNGTCWIIIGTTAILEVC